MRVAHDAQIEVTTIWPKAFGRTKDVQIMTPEQLEGCLAQDNNLLIGPVENREFVRHFDATKTIFQQLHGFPWKWGE